MLKDSDVFINLRILHLGDLHAGGDHDEEIKNKLFDYLQNSKMKFDVVILSGDLVDKAGKLIPLVRTKFKIVKEFLDKIRLITQVKVTRVVLVPGWHDIQTCRRYPFRKFVEFSNNFYTGSHIIIDPRSHSFNVIRHFDIGTLGCGFPVHFFALNSCDPNRWKKNAHNSYKHGFISSTQTELISNIVGKEEIERSFVILVFHHTPWPKTVGQGDSKAEQGAVLLRQVSSLSPSICLTGHWHYDLEGREIDGVLNFTAGHICCKGEPGSNQFNIFELSLFKHKKDIFVIKHQPVLWDIQQKNWQEKESKLYYSSKCKCTETIKQIIGG